MYLKYVENVIPLSKLIGLLFLFCLPLLSILFLKTKRNDLARPVMGTIFLVIIIMMKNRKNLSFLSGCGKALPALSWAHKCECRLEIMMFCACECLCTAYLFESGEVTA